MSYKTGFAGKGVEDWRGLSRRVAVVAVYAPLLAILLVLVLTVVQGRFSASPLVVGLLGVGAGVSVVASLAWLGVLGLALFYCRRGALPLLWHVRYVVIWPVVFWLVAVNGAVFAGAGYGAGVPAL